jgi:hypothetical protein
MNKPLLVSLVTVLITASACTTESPVSEPVVPSDSPTYSQSQPIKDCKHFEELAYTLKERTKGGSTERMTKVYVGEWADVVRYNSECFSNDEICEAIDAHNSVSPWGRQESSPYC